jgi:hypothetical protein
MVELSIPLEKAAPTTPCKHGHGVEHQTQNNRGERVCRLGDILNYGRPDVAANKNLHFIAFFRAEKSRSDRRLMMHDSS